MTATRTRAVLAVCALQACAGETIDLHQGAAQVVYVDAAAAGGAARGAPGPDASIGAPEADAWSSDDTWWAEDAGGAGPDAIVTPDSDAGADVHTPDVVPADAVADGDDPPPDDPCPPEVVCVEALPFSHAGDTAASGRQLFDSYGCAPEVDESGAEVVYRVMVPQDGFLSAALDHLPGLDVDVHILSALDPQAACLDRGHWHAGADVMAGTVWVVVDTWADDGLPLPGAYQLEIGLTVPSHGPCGVEVGVMERVGDGGDHLAMPATGPIVMEAHLVTQEEPPPYPATSTDELAAHFALSQASTGFVMRRDQVWAPLEGGDFYGAGIGSPALFPVEHEGWYVNMYWTKDARPERGTRMILREPGGDRAVVVAAGYETGPGNLAHIGGTPEETHFYLATGHLSVLTLGIATDQALPFGPRTCE